MILTHASIAFSVAAAAYCTYIIYRRDKAAAVGLLLIFLLFAVHTFPLWRY